MGNKKRPTFKTKIGKPIRAAGIILYNSQLGYLMQEKTITIKKNGIKCDIAEISDFGGKTDVVDNNALDTMLREFREETNNKIQITKTDLKIFRYFYESKYLLAIIKTNNSYQEEIKAMGKYEQHDSIARTVSWVKFPQNKKIVHCRLHLFFSKVNLK